MSSGALHDEARSEALFRQGKRVPVQQVPASGHIISAPRLRSTGEVLWHIRRRHSPMLVR